MFPVLGNSRIYWVSFEFPLDYIAGNMLFFIVKHVIFHSVTEVTCNDNLVKVQSFVVAS